MGYGEVFFTRSVRARRRGAVSRRNGREKTLKIDYKYNTSPVFRDITLDPSNAGGKGRGPRTTSSDPVGSQPTETSAPLAKFVRGSPAPFSTRWERAPDPFQLPYEFRGAPPEASHPLPCLGSSSLHLSPSHSLFLILCTVVLALESERKERTVFFFAPSAIGSRRPAFRSSRPRSALGGTATVAFRCMRVCIAFAGMVRRWIGE